MMNVKCQTRKIMVVSPASGNYVNGTEYTFEYRGEVVLAETAYGHEYDASTGKDKYERIIRSSRCGYLGTNKEVACRVVKRIIDEMLNKESQECRCRCNS